MPNLQAKEEIIMDICKGDIVAWVHNPNEVLLAVSEPYMLGGDLRITCKEMHRPYRSIGIEVAQLIKIQPPEVAQQ